MIVGLRRVLAGCTIAVVVGLWPVVVASAETASPEPVASASASAAPVASASPVATAAPSSGSSEAADDTDPAPDDSRQLIALAAAGGVALIAATVVFLRRR